MALEEYKKKRKFEKTSENGVRRHCVSEGIEYTTKCGNFSLRKSPGKWKDNRDYFTRRSIERAYRNTNTSNKTTERG
jgi:hypothetical protein